MVNDISIVMVVVVVIVVAAAAAVLVVVVVVVVMNKSKSNCCRDIDRAMNTHTYIHIYDFSPHSTHSAGGVVHESLPQR